MAFNAQSIYDRYNPSPSSNNVAVLKSDFKSICSDLLTLETYAATATSNKGKWSALYLAENTATPPTNLELTHLSGLRSTNAYYLMSSATTATSAGAVVRGIRFGADKVTSPATDIHLLDLKSATRVLSSITTLTFAASESVTQLTTGSGRIRHCLLATLISGLGGSAHTGTVYYNPMIWANGTTMSMSGSVISTWHVTLALGAKCVYTPGVGMTGGGNVNLIATIFIEGITSYGSSEGFTFYYQYWTAAQS